MENLTIILPVYKEPFLNKTLQSLLKGTGDKTILLPVIDGTDEKAIKHPRIKPIYLKKNVGMRGAINTGLKKAKTKYIMKMDAHCAVGKNFDEILIKDMKKNWLMIPRRYPLHADNWDRTMLRNVKDYHYLSFPEDNPTYGKGLYPQEWRERTRAHLNEQMIDDTMIFQGSCYLADRKYFMKLVGYLDDCADTYSTFSGEPLEVGLKYWLSGGKVKVNKNTWYAHLFKNANYYGKYESTRMYKKILKHKSGHAWATKHWMNSKEPNMVKSLSWLVEKFWPVPGWPKDRKLWTL